MKRFFLLLCVICVLYGLSWANNFGSSTEGQEASVTFVHTVALDSAWAVFGYDGDGGADTANFYDSLKLLSVFSGDGKILWADGLDLDSLGTHVVKIRGYASDAIVVITTGIWEHKTTAVDSVRKVYLVDSLDQEVSASVDTESVARSTWNDDIVPQANRTVTASCAGSGSDTFDIYVFDGDTTAIEGVDICIYNEGKTAKVLPSILTNVNGKAQVFLDAGIYPLYLQRLGVIYSQWDTITVSNGGIDTLWVTSYDPGSSPAGNLTTVKGFNRDFGFNKGERLTITFSLPYKNIIDTSQNVFIDRKEIMVYSDTGYFEANLIPGIFLLSQVSGAVKDSLKYNVKIGAPGRPVFEWNRFDVPDTTGAVWLIDLIR